MFNNNFLYSDCVVNPMVKYIKNDKNQKNGVLVSYFNIATNKVHIGYSVCCKKDKFNRETGIQIAFQRAVAYEEKDRNPNLPRIIKQALPYFIVRCSKYYKGKKFSSWVLDKMEEIANL